VTVDWCCCWWDKKERRNEEKIMIIRRTAAAAAASPSKNRIREYEITIVFMQIRKLLEECSLFSIIKKIFLLDDIIVVKKSVLPIHSIRGVIKVE